MATLRLSVSSRIVTLVGVAVASVTFATCWLVRAVIAVCRAAANSRKRNKIIVACVVLCLCFLCHFEKFCSPAGVLCAGKRSLSVCNVSLRVRLCSRAPLCPLRANPSLKRPLLSIVVTILCVVFAISPLHRLQITVVRSDYPKTQSLPSLSQTSDEEPERTLFALGSTIAGCVLLAAAYLRFLYVAGTKRGLVLFPCVFLVRCFGLALWSQSASVIAMAIVGLRRKIYVC